jgi:hypothetical protein
VIAAAVRDSVENRIGIMMTDRAVAKKVLPHRFRGAAFGELTPGRQSTDLLRCRHCLCVARRSVSTK